MGVNRTKKKRRLMMRRKRSLDPSLVIDYKKPDVLKRFITDRGKIIPRRISGATAAQQRLITESVKRARFLSLIPYTVAHRTEKGFAGEMSAAAAMAIGRRDSYGRDRDRPPRDRDRDRDRDNRSEAPRDEAPRAPAKEGE